MRRRSIRTDRVPLEIVVHFGPDPTPLRADEILQCLLNLSSEKLADPLFVYIQKYVDVAVRPFFAPFFTASSRIQSAS